MRGIKILGTGKYIPETVVKNSWFSSYLETDDEWITTRTGIKERRYSKDKPNFVMAAAAAAEAVENSGIKPTDIDLILASTCSPDFFYPSLSCLVQERIGAVNAAAYDINAACTGFISALDTASRYLQDGDYKNILIVASERLAPQIDFNDRSSCILFGDGAGAVVVTGSEKPMYSYFSAKGDFFKSLYCKVDYSRSNCPFLETDKIIEEYIGKTGKRLFLLFCWLFTLIVTAAFADMVAGTFNAYTVDTNGVIRLADAAKTNGAAGTISLLFIVFAMIFGLIHKHFQFHILMK